MLFTRMYWSANISQSCSTQCLTYKSQIPDEPSTKVYVKIVDREIKVVESFVDFIVEEGRTEDVLIYDARLLCWPGL